MIRIPALSDTHFSDSSAELPETLVEAGSADFIIFAGDYAEEEVWEQACSLGLTFAVHGNIDARLCVSSPYLSYGIIELANGEV